MQVVVIEPIHPEPLARLRREVDVVTWDDPRVKDWSNADGLIVRIAPVTREMILSGPKLRVIGKHGIGVNNIHIPTARERNIDIVYTPTANVNSVAELIVGFMLTLSRKIQQNGSMLRAGAARITPPELTGSEVTRKTIGFVGLGRIAQRTAEICRKGFDMETAAFDPMLPPERFAEMGMRRHESLEALMAACDVVAVCVPYTAQTHHLIGRDALAASKPGLILINTARGGIVDEAALADALRQGRLGGAASDVFETEPPPADHPLLAFPNFVGALHMGGSTHESLMRVGTTVVNDVLAVLRGDKPEFPFA